MKIKEIHEVTPRLVEAFKKLLPQLSSSVNIPTNDDWEKILKSPEITVFVAEENDKILGSLTLIIFYIPDGIRASIQNVVVDEDARGKGVGRALCDIAIRKAKELGVSTIDLTSNSERVAAIQLYKKMGFQKRDTNVYRYKIK